MHIFAILLFPVRLVLEPLVLPVTYYGWALCNGEGGQYIPFMPFFLGVSKAWLLWHGQMGTPWWQKYEEQLVFFTLVFIICLIGTAIKIWGKPN